MLMALLNAAKLIVINDTSEWISDAMDNFSAILHVLECTNSILKKRVGITQIASGKRKNF